jgi:hypothetical protein
MYLQVTGMVITVAIGALFGVINFNYIKNLKEKSANPELGTEITTVILVQI